MKSDFLVIAKCVDGTVICKEKGKEIEHVELGIGEYYIQQQQENEYSDEIKKIFHRRLSKTSNFSMEDTIYTLLMVIPFDKINLEFYMNSRLLTMKELIYYSEL